MTAPLRAESAASTYPPLMERAFLHLPGAMAEGAPQAEVQAAALWTALLGAAELTALILVKLRWLESADLVELLGGTRQRSCWSTRRCARRATSPGTT